MKQKLLNLTRLRSLLLLACVMLGMSAWGQITYTLGWGTASGDDGTYTNFVDVTGSVDNIISFSTQKNNSTSDPAYNSSSNELRLYYASNGNGGSITITPAAGKTITGAVITTSTTPSVKYFVDGGSALSVTASNNTYTISNISATTSLKIQNANTSNTQLRIKTITLTYTSYTITAQSNNESFGTVSLNGRVITGSPNSGFRYADPAYTVSPANSATVAQNGNEFTVTPSDNTTITINFEAIPTYTVTYSDGGTVTESVGGQGVTLATRSDMGDYTFAGWSEVDIEGVTTSTPTIISTSETYYPTRNITLYPVYTRSVDSGTTTEWHLTNLNVADAGVYALLTEDGYAFNGNINSSGNGEATAQSFSFNNEGVATIVPTDICEITFESVNGGFKMYNAVKGYLYAKAASSGNLAWHNSENSYWLYQSDNWTYASNNAYLRSYNNNSFRTYGTNNGKLLKLAKKVEVSSSTIYYWSNPTTDPYIIASDIELAFNATSGEIAYDLGNPDTGGSMTATTDSEWISLDEDFSSPIVFTCTTNTSDASRTAEVTLTYTYNTSETVTKIVTITQAATPDNRYELFSGSLVEGDYIIYYGGKAMKNTVSNNRLEYAEVTPENDIITTENAAIVWHIAPSGEYWTIYSAAAGKFAAATGTKNQAQMLTSGSDDKALWALTGTSTYEFENKARAAASSDSGNKWLRNNGTSGFACYATSTGGALSLYKKVIPEEVAITMNGSGIMTYASTYGLDFSEVEGLTAYFCQDYDADNLTLTMTAVNSTAPGDGMMLKGEAGEEYLVPIITEGSTSTTNLLVGLTQVTNVSKIQTIDNVEYTTLILANKESNGINWYVLAEDSYYLKANSAYLRLPSSALPTTPPANLSMDFGGGSNGINTTTATKVDAKWYTLDGRLLQSKPSTKGIYVNNGHKVVIK